MWFVLGGLVLLTVAELFVPVLHDADVGLRGFADRFHPNEAP